MIVLSSFDSKNPKLTHLIFATFMESAASSESSVPIGIGTANSMLHQLSGMVNTPEIKKEIRFLFRPVFDFLLDEMSPYLYGLLFFAGFMCIIMIAIMCLIISAIRTMNTMRNGMKVFQWNSADGL